MLPQHVAIIMDGNGRWALQRGLPRTEGHRQGAQSAQKAIHYCLKHQIPVLTLFAFGLENKARPLGEVQFLFDMLLQTLKAEAADLSARGVRLRIIGERSALNPDLQAAIAEVEALTAAQNRLTLNLAINFSGRWDVIQATQKIAHAVEAGQLRATQVDAACFQSYMSLGASVAPDLLIRTGAESRISNFLLFDIAYTELYFSKIMWPDFEDSDFDRALSDYAQRERRYGLTTQQLGVHEDA